MTGIDRTSYWDDVWRRKAPEEVSWFEASPEVSLGLLDAVGAGPTSVVVDVGAGASRLVDALLARGFVDVTALDISPAALEATRRRLAAAADGVEWIVADVTRWRPTRTYDVWPDRAAFPFLEDDRDRRAHRNDLERAHSPGGHAIVSTFAPDGPERCSGLPVVRQDAEALASFFGPAFELARSVRHDHRTPGGAVQRFQFTVLRKSS